MIRIETRFHSANETKPHRIKAWVKGREQVSGRKFLTIPYDHRLTQDYGADAAFREAAEQLALQCRLGAVGDGRQVANGWIFTVLKEQVQDDADDDQDQNDDHQGPNRAVHQMTSESEPVNAASL